MAVAFVAAFVAFYLLAPAIAGRFGRPLTGPARQAAYAGPASLFVFAVIAYSYPADASLWPLFAPLLGLVVLCAWRAMALEQGGLFFAASFLAVAAEAVWSATTPDRRAPAGGGEHLRALRRRDVRRAAGRAAPRASSPSCRRRGPRPARQPRAPAVPVERLDRPVRLVVTRAAAGDPQCRPVHRERGGADAGAVAGRQRVVLGNPRPVVVPNRGGGRRPSQPRGRHRPDAHHPRRAHLGALLPEELRGRSHAGRTAAPRRWDCSVTLFCSSWR